MKLPRDGKIYWMKQGLHQDAYTAMTKLLVPRVGASEALCGELLRVWSRFYNEYYTLGSVNLAICKTSNPDRHALHKVALWFSNNCGCLKAYGLKKRLTKIQLDYRKLFSLNAESVEAIMDLCIINASMITLTACMTRPDEVLKEVPEPIEKTDPDLTRVD